MASVDDIGWGSYGCWEGPFYKGKFPYKPSASPTKNEKVLAIIASTEGRTDAINMYDGQVLSAGPIQNVERAQYAVSSMLGFTAEANEHRLYDFVMDTLGPALEASKASFNPTPGRPHRWRFCFKDIRGEVDRDIEQRQLMHLGSDGKKGTWTGEDAEHGKLWASCVASVWENEDARKAQVDFLVPHLRRYAFRESAKFVSMASGLDTNLGDCFVAAYLTFAINNPTRANKHLLIGDKNAKGKRFSKEWLIDVLKEMTFGPRIALYPHRYNAVVSKLKEYYGIDLPDIADELKEWQADVGFSWLPSTMELQMALQNLGHDLGPRGADGDFGPKTTNAVLIFEQLHKLPHPDGMPDPIMVRRLEQELEARGMASLLKEKEEDETS